MVKEAQFIDVSPVMLEGWRDEADVSLLMRLAVYGSTLALGVLVVVLDCSPGFWEWLARWWY